MGFSQNLSWEIGIGSLLQDPLNGKVIFVNTIYSQDFPCSASHACIKNVLIVCNNKSFSAFDIVIIP